MAGGSAVYAGNRLTERSEESPRFILAALEIEGLERLEGRDVISATGLSVGDNILDVDLRQVQDRIEDMSWVERALVLRKPPDRLIVSLVERKRAAWVDVNGLRTVDANGVLLPEVGSDDTYVDIDLPVISGLSVNLDSLREGKVVADSNLVRILAWLQKANAFDQNFCMNISEIMPMKDEALRIILVADGLEVRLPTDNVADRLQVLRAAMPRLYKDLREPTYVDLRFARQAVVGADKGGS